MCKHFGAKCSLFSASVIHLKPMIYTSTQCVIFGVRETDGELHVWDRSFNRNDKEMIRYKISVVLKKKCIENMH